MASSRAQKLAPWSASKIQTALRCPREFHYRYIEKIPQGESSPEAIVGKAVHAALEHALQGTLASVAVSEARAALTTNRERERFDRLTPGIPTFLERIAEFRQRRRVNRQLVEFTLAVRADFTVTSFYAGDCFYRGIFDAGYAFDDTLAIIDHKTGFRTASSRITEQLQGYAVLAAAAFRRAKHIWLGVHWVGDGDVEWAPPVHAAEIQSTLVPRVVDNIAAAALAVDDGPRPDPGVWCGYCSYRSICRAAYEARYEPVDDGLDDDLHD